MACKEYLIKLFDELLLLFEDSNKILYKKLFLLRHQIRNVLTSEQVYDTCKDLISTHIDKIKQKDSTLFVSSMLEDVWFEMSPSNRHIVWQWIDTITTEIM